MIQVPQGFDFDLANYAGLWAIEESRFSQLVWQVQKMDLLSHVKSFDSTQLESRRQEFSVAGRDDDVAIVALSGAMTKKGSSLSSGGSTIRARRAIRQAVNDKSIERIVLHVDSPGGTVAGTADLAAEIRNAKKSKPVTAFVEDLAASAAMWVVSQASEVFANEKTALVGSIGTFMGLYDLSQMAENEGIKPVVIKAGEFKAGGFPGTEISEEQIAEWQKVIDATQEQFTKAISKGRNMPVAKVRELVTGLTYMADDALSFGLIDGIRSFDEVVSQMQQNPKNRSHSAMSESASFNDLVSACAGIQTSEDEDTMFIVDCQKKDLTVDAASAAWASTLLSRIATAREENAALQKENKELKSKVADLEKTPPKSKGVDPIGTRGKSEDTPEGDPKADWNSAIQKNIDSGLNRQKAVAKAAKDHPELRQSMLDTVNAN